MMKDITSKIDLLNIGLVILSFLIAIKLPFKLFLFSYAILGPLHYLTEINWLNKKNFFMSSTKKWFWFFIGITLLVSSVRIAQIIDLTKIDLLNQFVLFLKDRYRIITLSVFMFSVTFLFKMSFLKRLMALLASIFLSIAFYLYIPTWLLFFGVFIPTIIHVYLFTLLFVLYGSRKSKSILGYMTATLIILVPIAILFLEFGKNSFSMDPDTQTTYLSSNFQYLNAYIAQIMGMVENNNFDLISSIGMKIQIFIAFAYTYHYLNWFSKTSIIGWKESISKKNAVVIGIIWTAAILIYQYDYRLGFNALFFLSYLHVVLEFPLNWITIKELVPSSVGKT